MNNTRVNYIASDADAMQMAEQIREKIQRVRNRQTRTIATAAFVAGAGIVAGIAVSVWWAVAAAITAIIVIASHDEVKDEVNRNSISFMVDEMVRWEAEKIAQQIIREGDKQD